WPGDTNGRARATVAVAELDYTGDTTRDAWCGYAAQHTIAAIVELVREIGVRRRDRYGCQPARCTGIAEGRSARDTKVRALGLHVTALFVEHDPRPVRHAAAILVRAVVDQAVGRSAA